MKAERPFAYRYRRANYRAPTASSRALLAHDLTQDLGDAVGRLLAAYEANPELNTEQPEGVSEVYAASLDEWLMCLGVVLQRWKDKAATPSPCVFTFDGPNVPSWLGFDTGGDWNGFAEIAVSPDVLEVIAKWADGEEEAGAEDHGGDDFRQAPMVNGLAVLEGYTCHIQDAADFAVTVDGEGDALTLAAFFDMNGEAFDEAERLQILLQVANGQTYEGGGGAAAEFTVTPMWREGAYVEYANGFGAEVAHIDGEFAVLECHKPHGFTVVQGNPTEFSFPFEESDPPNAVPESRATLAEALSDLQTLKAEA